MWTRVLVVLSRLRAALLAARLDTDLRDELRSHLDLLAEDQRGRGLTAAEARRAVSCRRGRVIRREAPGRLPGRAVGLLVGARSRRILKSISSESCAARSA